MGGSQTFLRKPPRGTDALHRFRPDGSLRRDGYLRVWLWGRRRDARCACLPPRSRFIRACSDEVPTQAGTSSGAPPVGGGPAPAPSGAVRKCSAAFCATSCSRFAFRSIFNQRALFLIAVRAW